MFSYSRVTSSPAPSAAYDCVTWQAYYSGSAGSCDEASCNRFGVTWLLFPVATGNCCILAASWRAAEMPGRAACITQLA